VAAGGHSPLEFAIRNFTICRKNWLFSASTKGAAASAAVYSIVETSKANGFDSTHSFMRLTLFSL